MATAAENRLIHLLTFLSKERSVEIFADKVGLSAVYLRQLKDGAIDVKTGKVRQMGDKAARKIEEALGLESGYMDSANHQAHFVAQPTAPYVTNQQPLRPHVDTEQLTDEQRADIDRLGQVMTRLGMTPENFAARLSWPLEFLSQYLNMKKPITIDVLADLAFELDVDPEEISPTLAKHIHTWPGVAGKGLAAEQKKLIQTAKQKAAAIPPERADWLAEMIKASAKQ